MSQKDPYDILGLDRTATPEEIKKKYKKLALQFHPDKNPDPNSSEKFKEISQAYKDITSRSDNEIFNDFPELNAIFSMFGLNFGQNFSQGQGHQAQNFTNLAMSGLSHLFKQKGQPVQTKLVLSLEEIYNGGSFDVKYQVHRQTGNMKKTVNTRQIGAMFVQEVTMTPETIVSEEMTTVSVYPCYNPRVGPVILQNIISYGGSHGSYGSHNGGSMNGDLEVYIEQKEHPLFTRIDDDLIIKLEITLKEALTGFEKSIKHIDGTDIKINCKSIISHGSEKTIAGSGLKENGSLIIKFSVIFPTELTTEQKEKLLQIL